MRRWPIATCEWASPTSPFQLLAFAGAGTDDVGDAGREWRIPAGMSFAFRTLVTGGIYDTQCGFKVFRGDVAAEVFRLARIDGFAIDVELIYLLLKYRLDLKRIPVVLERNAPSSVRVVRDSATAFRDIATIRWNWATGRYRSPALAALLQEELRVDVEEVAPPQTPPPAVEG